MASNLKRSKKTIGHAFNDTSKRVSQLQKRSAARRIAPGVVTPTNFSPAITTNLNNIDAAASGAQSTADGKNSIFYTSSVPTANKTGDLWFDTDDNFKLYRALSDTANEIAVGEWQLAVVNGTNITAGTIDASQVTVSNIDAGRITAGTISVTGVGGVNAINAGSPFGGLYPFSVNSSGVVRSISGTIGGFTLSSSTLSASSGNPSSGVYTTISVNSNGLISSLYQDTSPSFYEEVKINNYAAGGSGAINVTGTASGSLQTRWYTSYGVYNPSDIRLKNVINESIDALGLLSQIETTKFTFKNDDSKREHFGFIAQQVNEHIPYIAVPGGEDENTAPWGIVQDNFIPYLVRAVQQLLARIEELESRL